MERKELKQGDFFWGAEVWYGRCYKHNLKTEEQFIFLKWPFVLGPLMICGMLSTSETELHVREDRQTPLKLLVS